MSHPRRLTMGCCGEPIDKAATTQREQHVKNSYPVSQQPSPHPGLGAPYQEKFVPPSIPSPPLVQQLTGQQPWHQQTIPGIPRPMSSGPMDFNPYQVQVPSPPPTHFTGTTVAGSASGMGGLLPSMSPHNSLRAPSTYFNQSPSIMTTAKADPIRASELMPNIDEGRMSVSIDFG